MIVFILGRTGSGKSTTARFLGEVARCLGWSVRSFNDYYFLRDMYLTDITHRFRPTENDGFEVLDLSVYETAIRLLAQQVRSYYYENKQTLITVEFTSNNYREALRLFDSELLRDARFLFLMADLNTCLERTSKRIVHKTTEDDYYVKDTVLLRHYPSPYMPLYIGENKVNYIHNMGSLEYLWNSILALTPTLLEQKVPKRAAVLAGKPTLSVAERFSLLWSNLELTWEHFILHK
jgi:hypothetical protein